MKLTFIKLFILVFLPVLSLAQSNFYRGFIVSHAGDTIKGEIDVRESVLNPTSISFRSSSGEISEKTKDDINYVEISGIRAYKLYTVNLSSAPTDFSKLNVGIDTSSITQTVFLEIIQSGYNVTLLSYVDKIKDRYYLLETNELIPAELIYRSYYSNGQKSLIKDDNIFRNQLQRIAKKYIAVDDKLERRLAGLRYTDDDINPIINRINNNSNNPKQRNEIRFFAGITINKNISSFENDPLFGNSKSPVSYTPKVSLGFDILNNPVVQKFIFRTELSFSYSHQAFGTLERTALKQVETKYSLVQYTATLAPKLLYNFYNTNKLKVFIAGGFGLNYSIYPTNEVSSEAYYTGVRKDFRKLRSAWGNLPFETGLTFNRQMDIAFKYSVSTFSKYTDSALSTQIYGLGVRWYFKRKE